MASKKFEEAERIMQILLPSETHGEDGNAESLYNIITEYDELLEKAFLSGRSKQSWIDFKKEHDL